MPGQLLKGHNIKILQKMDKDSIDCTITSAPYNKQESKNAGQITKAVMYDFYSDNLPEGDYQQQQKWLLDEVYRVTKKGGHCFYNHKIRYDDGQAIAPWYWLRDTEWTIRQEIVWDRILASNIRGWRFWNVDERIYWLYKPHNDNDKGNELKSHWAKMGSIWRFPPETKVKDHPAPFPTELPRRILKALYPSGAGKVILDPYIGSGTTAVVAKELGHDYIGIDISEKYLKLAQARIDEAVRQDCSLTELFGDG